MDFTRITRGGAAGRRPEIVSRSRWVISQRTNMSNQSISEISDSSTIPSSNFGVLHFFLMRNIIRTLKKNSGIIRLPVLSRFWFARCDLLTYWLTYLLTDMTIFISVWFLWKPAFGRENNNFLWFFSKLSQNPSNNFWSTVFSSENF